MLKYQMLLQMLSFTFLEASICSSCRDILKPTEEKKNHLNCDSDLNKKANKRSIGDRAVKGCSFKTSFAKTTMKLKRFALKSIHEALCTDLLMSVFVMSLFLCVPITHKHTQG